MTGERAASSVRVIAGLGCRRNTDAGELLRALDAALAEHGFARADVAAVATSPSKAAEPGMARLAAGLGRPLVAVPIAALADAESRVATRSSRVAAAVGVASIAEAAALVAAGAGSRLLGPRVQTGCATCALALTDSGDRTGGVTP